MSDMDILDELWNSDAANSLTNRAAREMERLRAEVASLKAENATLLAANKDCLAHFDSLMADYKATCDANVKLAQRLREAEEYGEKQNRALGNIFWAATERDRKNRIRQFDEYVDAAKKALSLPKPWDKSDV